jgi:hypothetical protein
LRLIHRALDQTGSNVSKAARILGVSRDYLRYRLAEPKPAAPAVGDPNNRSLPDDKGPDVPTP